MLLKVSTELAPGCFYERLWDGGNCFFLDLGVGCMSSVCGNSEVCTFMTCAFSVCMSYFDKKTSLKFLGETKLTTLKLQKLTTVNRNKKISI